MFIAFTPACGENTETYSRNIESVCVKVTLPTQSNKLERIAAQWYSLVFVFNALKLAAHYFKTTS